MKGWTLSVACEETATASDEEKWSSSKWSISAKRGGVLDMEGVCFLVLEDCLLEAWSAEGKTDDAESKERKARGTPARRNETSNGGERGAAEN